MKPRRTTSKERILLGMDSTFSESSSTISPCSSSPITGKKLSSTRTFCFLESLSPLPPDVLEFRSFANSSKIISVLAGSKSNTYAFCLTRISPHSVYLHGFWLRKAACIYKAGDLILDSISTAVHSGIVIPVVS